LSWGRALAAVTAGHPMLTAAVRTIGGPGAPRAFALPDALVPWRTLGECGPVSVDILLGAAIVDAFDAPEPSVLRTALFASLGGAAHEAAARLTGDRGWTRTFVQSVAWQGRLHGLLEPILGGSAGTLLRRLQARALWWPVQSRGRPEDVLEDARRAAVLPLALSADCHDAWEVNRAGFLDRPELHGDLFGPLIVAASVPGPIGRSIAEAAGRRRPTGRPVYYRDLPQMPLDTDDAAAVLQAAKVHPGSLPGALLQTARRVLAQALREDGTVDTWVVLPGEPAPEPPLASWYGPLCPAIAARAGAAGVWHPEDKARVVERLLDRAVDGAVHSPHYADIVVSTAMVHALTADPATRAFLHAAPGGSALAEAERALALCRSGAVEDALYYDVLARLLRARRWDGRWPAADWFVCPHPSGELRPFGSVTVSSVRVQAALRQLGRRPPEGRPADSAATAR